MTTGRYIHSRYERGVDGLLCIDVATDKAEDLYNNFDRNAPYIRRDLNQDLADYLIECAAELLPQAFAIRFTFNLPHDADTLNRIRNSVATYFQYLADRERDGLRKMFTRSGIFLVVGVGILVGSVMLNRWLGEERSVVANVFGEGMTIAAWVALWEALAVFLVEWLPQRRQLRIYKTLAEAPLLFR
jgi:hypothetical protein